MKISTKVECGIIALVDIAVNSAKGEVVKVAAISERNNISAKYLEQILPHLRQSHIINSVKGASGGYVLARPSAEITLREIVDALDNTILAHSLFSEKLDSAANTAISLCLWEPVTHYMQDFSAKLTLREITDKFSELITAEAETPMYYI
ncbi:MULTISPECIES: Rrf2 family transcriptional regulator [Ruminococcus]|uniref:RrF2 family transcriptional regulator n=1 Tax=Ruminococcus TaxID=1263 RepID=UPI0013DBF9EA|nr:MULTISPECIES: Rrf2 family transcriptional regulator [Ruminococcus]MBQ6169917.1 Rrf2 family transcriptional regulator [Ruminococcus sp.]MBR1431978.1 Rrf2 family transcriptional regulator [Ruminococcus sp.]